MSRITASGLMAAILGVLLIVAAVQHVAGLTVGICAAVAVTAAVALGSIAAHDRA